jgi:hypothetical protein
MRLVGLTLLAIFSSGCGLLVGNVKPVDQKSGDYRVLDLTEEPSAEWQKLDPEEANTRAETTAQGENPAGDPGQGSTETTDVAYQSKRTDSIISMNTACRPSLKWEDKVDVVEREKHLRQFTRELLLGISDIGERQERMIRVQDLSALETTVLGKLSGRTTKLRTVVLRQGQCIYDLMYIAKPSVFDQDEPAFSRFVASLRLRR